jgi:hypothetical protein
LLIEKVAKDHADEISRKATLNTSLEDSARFLQRTMVALNRLTSVLVKEEAVNITVQEQKSYIDGNIVKMVDGISMTETQAEHLFNEICNMAVCQWKIQGEALRSMPPNREQSTTNTTDDPPERPYQGNHNGQRMFKGRPMVSISGPEMSRLGFRPEMSREHNGQKHASGTPSPASKHSTMVSMVEDMNVLTKQQIKSSEMMISMVEAMGTVIEQQKKTSEMMMEMVRQMTDNDTSQTNKEGILGYVQEDARYGDVTDASVEEMLDTMSDDDETDVSSGLSRKEHFRIMLNAMSDDKESQRYRHLINLTTKATRKSFIRRIKKYGGLLGSLRWMWIKLLGGSFRNAMTTELRSQHTEHMMNQLCGIRQSYTDLSKTDQEFLKANHQQFSSNCMPSCEKVQPLPKGTPFTKSCIQCNESFSTKEERYKRCSPCQVEWRKTHPYIS